ncbi:unnamed protein product [Arabidopsis halleri]
MMCLYDPLAVTKFYGIVFISEMRMAESTRIRVNPTRVPVNVGRLDRVMFLTLTRVSVAQDIDVSSAVSSQVPSECSPKSTQIRN